MTLEEYAREMAAGLAGRNAGIPFDALLRLQQTVCKGREPKATPREMVDVLFQTRVVISMTAEEWETAADPEPMLIRTRFHVPNHQFTRFACECCRRIWDLIPGDDIRRIVEATEELLQGILSQDERYEFFDVLDQPRMESLSGAARSAEDAVGELFELGFDAAFCASRGAAEARAGGTSEGPAYTAERAAQAALLRELVGNPLRND